MHIEWRGMTLNPSHLPATICGLYLMFGVACTFFGYRCFKAVMFFTGFVFASIVVYLARTLIGFGCGRFSQNLLKNMQGWRRHSKYKIGVRLMPKSTYCTYSKSPMEHISWKYM